MLSEDQVRAIVGAELSQADSDWEANIEGNMERALNYYLGNPRGDEVQGRSRVISTDVADAVEWILPQIVESLVKAPVIRFDPVSEEDSWQAELESDYTHSVFMSENDGFLNLYQFVKDALLHKNGILKIWYDPTPERAVEHYDGLSEEQALALEMDPDLEILETVERVVISPAGAETRLDIAAARTVSQGRISVCVIPPEDFRVASGHGSLSLEDARFVSHSTNRTVSDLLQEGYDPDILDRAGAEDEQDNLRMRLQGESYSSWQSEDKSQKLVRVNECFIRLDVDEDGIAELWKVVLLGSGQSYELLDMEAADEIPFAAATAIVMPHKFYGLSIFDRLSQIQDQKTSLWRNTLDNLYLQTNREKEVVEGMVNLQDMMTSRPGNFIRVKQPGMVRELETSPIGRDAYEMMGYLDSVRTGRVGVSPDTQGQDLPVGAETAHGVERLMTAKEKLTGLMIRSIAETGLKSAYRRIRDLLVRHRNSVTAYKFRDSWAQVNPATWGPRSRITVSVGTGTGDDLRRQAALVQVLTYQEKALAMPGQTIVAPTGVYAALSDLADVAGLPSASRYFIDPDSPQGQQMSQQASARAQAETEQQQQLQQAMAQAQSQISQAELMKGQASMAAQQVKLQTELRSAQYEAQIEQLKAQIEQLKSDQRLRYDYARLQSESALKLTELELSANRDLSAQMTANKEMPQ